jgi:hypothetical protein
MSIPTFNILQRVFNIKVDGGTGTAFAIEVENQQYLVTAKHLFGDNLNTKQLNRSIEYKKVVEINEKISKVWLSINAKVFLAENSDVAVIQ